VKIRRQGPGIRAKAHWVDFAGASLLATRSPIVASEFAPTLPNQAEASLLAFGGAGGA
jgi:hypothetical protein